MALRRNYLSLTESERDRLTQAFVLLKASGQIDLWAAMHARHFAHGIHRSSHFLPWHRELVLRVERQLQVHHADIAIPYWDSTVDTSTSSLLWKDSFFGQFDAAWGLGRRLGSATLPTPAMVSRNYDQRTYDAFWPELERAIHNPPHVWVGGVMARADSPGDPVFYLHHCWIDLLWARWQSGHSGAPFVASGPNTELNDPLMEWPDRRAADVIDVGTLGYGYEWPA